MSSSDCKFCSRDILSSLSPCCRFRIKEAKLSPTCFSGSRLSIIFVIQRKAHRLSRYQRKELISKSVRSSLSLLKISVSNLERCFSRLCFSIQLLITCTGAENEYLASPSSQTYVLLCR